MENQSLVAQPKDEMVIYQTEDGTIKIDVLFDQETVWLSADQMGQLFGKSKSTISEHLKNIFEEGELQRDSVVRNFRTTASDSKIEVNTPSTFISQPLITKREPIGVTKET